MHSVNTLRLVALSAAFALVSGACAPGAAEPTPSASLAVTPLPAPAVARDPLASELALPAVDGHQWLAAWDSIIGAAIAQHSPQLLRADALPAGEAKWLCPGFATATSLERQNFWTLFLAAVSRFESGFNPQAKYTEAWRDPETGAPQLSAGLLQLSYSDRRGHPDCRLDRTLGNIFDPQVNLACGVAILRQQLVARATLFPKPRPYYWSVLTSKKVRPRLVAYLEQHVDRLPFCRKPG